MRRARAPFVVFSVAAGPEIGYGHLVRAGVLADALGVERQIIVRGSQTAIDTAIALGWTVHCGSRVIDWLLPDLLVVDDPSADVTNGWIRRAQRLDVPVAAVYDGQSRDSHADLVIDGSLMARPAETRTRISGPQFAILDWRIATRRAVPAIRDSRRVLIALGGGAHVGRVGAALARAITDAVPTLRVDLAAGFAPGDTLPDLPANCRWFSAPHGLVPYLSRAGVAVVAGGVTLYEACALGCPIVAVPVVAGQRRAIDAAARAGAVVDARRGHTRASAESVAAAVISLVADPLAARSQGRRARQLVDGRGAGRVADRLRALLLAQGTGRWTHAA